MYADRYGQRSGLKPGSMILALGVTALPIAGLVLSAEVTRIIKQDPTFRIESIAAPKPPPQIEIKPSPQHDAKAPPIERTFAPPTRLDIKPANPIDTGDLPLPPLPPFQPGTGDGGLVGIKPPPPAVLTDAGIDPRFAAYFQPPYPAEEVRAGREGRVVVRVLIGTDGRVKQVVRVSATTDAFFAAAERQALTKWHFKPATRDGTPIEQWKQMSLRFELNGNE